MGGNCFTSRAFAALGRWRSRQLSRLIDDGGGSVVVNNPLMRIRIRKDNGSRLVVNGTIAFTPSLEGDERTTIHLCEGSTLKISGDFQIGNGVRIWLDKNASLFVGGRKNESGSGITCNSTILVRKKLVIGHDFVAAWQVFITDCDWHGISGRTPVAPTHIGDKVWIAHGASILKGTRIGDGCVVAAHSVCSGREYPANALLAGAPARVVREGMNWSREMSDSA
jgi:acetyltransferase-like isoleucine patch superfamily enzyme